MSDISAEHAPARVAGAAPPRRGRPRLLTRQAILDAARAFERDSLTMAALAAQLGVSAPALYNYFSDRAELFAALAAEERANVPIPPVGERSWQEWLADYACLVRDAMIDFDVRPGWAPAGFVAFSVRLSDACLGVLFDAGFDHETAVRYLRIIGGCCYLSGSSIRRLRRNGPLSPADVERDYYDTVGLPPDAPLRRVVSLLTDPDEEKHFHNDLATVIRSMENALRPDRPPELDT
jgi:AcrR family transcriptional regulator